jgi:hypothetical protein
MEANCACSFWKCWWWDGTLLRNSPRPKGTEKINATRRLQLEQNSKTIECQLKIIEGCGKCDRKQGQQLGPQTNEDVDNGWWHYKHCFERSLKGRRQSWPSLPCLSSSSPGRGKHSLWFGNLPSPSTPAPAFTGFPEQLRRARYGFLLSCQCSHRDAFGLFWKVTWLKPYSCQLGSCYHLHQEHLAWRLQ